MMRRLNHKQRQDHYVVQTVTMSEIHNAAGGSVFVVNVFLLISFGGQDHAVLHSQERTAEKDISQNLTYFDVLN